MEEGKKQNGLLNRIRGFFVTVGRSCYNMELYRQVRTRPWTRALAYSLIFFALLSLALTLSASVGAYRLLGDLEDGIRAQVPEGSEFTVKDGRFSTTLEPGTEYGEEGFALVFDDGVVGKDFPRSFEDRIGVLVGRDAVFTQEEDGSRDILPIEGVPDFSFTKGSVLDWLGRYGALLVAGLLFLFLGMHYSFSILGALVYAAATALLTLVLGRIWKIRLGYGQWFAVGLHALTLPTLVDYLFGFLGLDVPFAFSVIYFMFMFSVIADERARPVRKKKAGDTPPETKLD